MRPILHATVTVMLAVGACRPQPQPQRQPEPIPSTLDKTGTPPKVSFKDESEIAKLILATKPISVANASNDADGDIIAPKSLVEHRGSGPGREAIYEERRRLTKTLESIVAFNPNADTLFPCSIVQGSGLADGVLNPIAVGRTPATVTVTDLGVSAGENQSFSADVSTPNLAKVTDAVSDILRRHLKSTQPAKFVYTETQFATLDVSLLRLGASAKWLSGSLSGSLRATSSSSQTSHLVRFVQSYYTVSCEAPRTPTSFISPLTTLADFKNYVGEDNPPAYVASVTYGREVWALIESNTKSSDVEAALNAAFSAAFVDGKIDLSSQHKKVLSESSMRLLAIGGDPTAGIKAIEGDRVANLRAFLASGARFSASSPGLPISYVVRYMRDNTVARISSSGDYVIRTVVPDPKPYKLVSMRATWHTQGDDKDWDTQPVVEVFSGDRKVGEIACCSSDRNSDNWRDGRDETRSMSILVSGLTTADLSSGSLSAKRNPNGNDDWDYRVTVEFLFEGGGRAEHSCEGRNSCSVKW